jgi:O-antigen/teichoic acid export membrane protein
MCGLFALLAEAVSEYYAIADLRWLLLACSSILLIDAFQITYNTRLVRDLRYKRKSAYDLTAVTVSSFIGVVLAFFGAGVWSIVGLQVSHSLCVLLLYVVFEERMSRWKFSLEK